MQQSAAHSAGIAHNRQALPSQVPRQSVSSDGYQKPGENFGSSIAHALIATAH